MKDKKFYRVVNTSGAENDCFILAEHLYIVAFYTTCQYGRMSFFSELKRRNVLRVAIAYIALWWVVLQVTDIVVPAPPFRDMLNQPALKAHINSIGLHAFWRANRWPHFCRPVGDDDCECQDMQGNYL